VTSAYRSATLGRSIALALVAGGHARIGSAMTVPGPVTRRWAGWRPAFPGMAMLRRHGMDKPDGGGGDAGGNETSIGGFRVTVTAPVFFDPDGDRLRAAVTSADTGGAAAFAAIPFRLAAAGFSHAAVRLHPLAPTTRLSIQSGPAAASSIGRALGVLLPTVPCRAVTARDRAALWLGPDEWLVLAPLAADDLVRTVMAALDGAPASVVDVSHRTVAYEITGPRAAWCLNAFCALDLDQRAFPIGMCTRTLLGKAEIVLWRTGGETFHIETARSLAPYVRDCLAEAAQEVAQEVTGEFPGPAEP